MVSEVTFKNVLPILLSKQTERKKKKTHLLVLACHSHSSPRCRCKLSGETVVMFCCQKQVGKVPVTILGILDMFIHLIIHTIYPKKKLFPNYVDEEASAQKDQSCLPSSHN